MSEAARSDLSEQLSAGLGERIRQARVAQGLSARAFARSLGLSPSLISQIELGKALPSVGTLFAMVSKLGLSLDEIFFDAATSEAPAELAPVAQRSAEGAGPTAGEGVVQRSSDRRSITLASGVRWERLTPDHDYETDFLAVTYGVGAESCPEDALMTHSGKEYGLVVEGRLGATIGFASYELSPGDSIAFEAAVPHRFWTIGDVPTRVVWTIVGRQGDPRFAPGRPAG
jgi:transcriptional regulator with XRE-family HTH domain